MNFLHRGFRKLSSDRHTDTHTQTDALEIICRLAGGQKYACNNSAHKLCRWNVWQFTKY